MSRIGLMLYTVRDACAADDFEGTLRQVAEMGYEGVELFDLHGHDRRACRLARRARARRRGRHARLEAIETRLAGAGRRGAACSAAAPRASAGSSPRSSTMADARRASPRPRGAAARTGLRARLPQPRRRARRERPSSTGCSPTASSSSSTSAGPGTPAPTRSRSLGTRARSCTSRTSAERGTPSFARRRRRRRLRARRPGRGRAPASSGCWSSRTRRTAPRSRRPPLARSGRPRWLGERRMRVGRSGSSAAASSAATTRRTPRAFDSFELVACADLDAGAGRALGGPAASRSSTVDELIADPRSTSCSTSRRRARTPPSRRGARGRQARLHREAAGHDSAEAVALAARPTGAGCGSAAHPTSSSAAPTRLGASADRRGRDRRAALRQRGDARRRPGDLAPQPGHLLRRRRRAAARHGPLLPDRHRRAARAGPARRRVRIDAAARAHDRDRAARGESFTATRRRTRRDDAARERRDGEPRSPASRRAGSTSAMSRSTARRACSRSPIPNAFDGPVRLSGRRGGWEDVPFASRGAADARGIGLHDMVEAIAAGQPHRASGELGAHVVEVARGILRSRARGGSWRSPRVSRSRSLCP